ncbi:MAG: hypothetical protein RLZZ450_7322, partial [Pseudomonadota bacterium]
MGIVLAVVCLFGSATSRAQTGSSELTAPALLQTEQQSV